MDDDLDNLFDETGDADQVPEPEQPQEAEQTATAEAPAEAEATPPTGEEEAAPPAAEEKEEARHVPYEALKDERTKRQNLEREIEEMRRWRTDMEARARKAQIEAIEDPDQRIAAERQQWQEAMISERRESSRARAVRQHGEDYVQQVTELFNDPRHAPMSHQFLADPDPFDAAIDYYKRVKALEEIGDDPEAYKKRIREELAAEAAASLSSAKPAAPPPSMAAAPAQGRNNDPVLSGYDAEFGG